jgi:hypothetical protein
VGEDRTVCVGLNTYKAKIAVEVRFHGEIAIQPDVVRCLIEQLGAKHDQLNVCYTTPHEVVTDQWGF